jgi:hypothetical protein
MAKNGDKKDSRESQEGRFNFLHENRFEKYSSFFSETLIFFKFSEIFLDQGGGFMTLRHESRGRSFNEATHGSRCMIKRDFHC